jgi:hypothetical protein
MIVKGSIEEMGQDFIWKIKLEEPVKQRSSL